MRAFDNKWVRQILALQQEDGSWGHFHTLSQPTKQQPMTTEQALRRLRILGLTKEDEPIAHTLVYMEHNLLHPHPTVFHEKKHDSKTYGDLMLAAWIRLFDPDNNTALSVAKKWAKVITCAFQSGEYSHAEYVTAYESEFTKLNPKADCLADFVVDWVKSQQDENGQWDMGSAVKDGIHFPLSDSWRKTEDRKRDCTSRVIHLLAKLEVTN